MFPEWPFVFFFQPRNKEHQTLVQHKLSPSRYVVIQRDQLFRDRDTHNEHPPKNKVHRSKGYTAI